MSVVTNREREIYRGPAAIRTYEGDDIDLEVRLWVNDQITERPVIGGPQPLPRIDTLGCEGEVLTSLSQSQRIQFAMARQLTLHYGSKNWKILFPSSADQRFKAWGDKVD